MSDVYSLRRDLCFIKSEIFKIQNNLNCGIRS